MSASPLVVDTHRHFLPAPYLDAVGRERIGATTPHGWTPTWTAEDDMEDMDRAGISKAISSISPGLWVEGREAKASLARTCNEIGARLAQNFPDRYGFFAVLPMPDTEATLREIEYALDVLKADGVLFFTNYDGKYLGDPAFADVLAELDRRAAVIFVHPTQPAAVPDALPAAIMEFPFDTTRTITSLLYAGCTYSAPHIRWIFSHAGGAFPFLSGRICGAARFFRPELIEQHPEGLEAEVAKLYFDTALSANPAAISALLQVTSADHILLGTDYPFYPAAAKDVAIMKGLVDQGIAPAGALGANACKLFGIA